MKKAMIENAKYAITLATDKTADGRPVSVVAVYDNKAGRPWSDDEMMNRGLCGCIGMDILDKSGRVCCDGLDMVKETLCWNLNGDSSKFGIKWQGSGKNIACGTAYVFD